VECSSDQCKQRRSEFDNEVKMLRRELKARDEDVRQLELETQVSAAVILHVNVAKFTCEKNAVN